MGLGFGPPAHDLTRDRRTQRVGLVQWEDFPIFKGICKISRWMIDYLSTGEINIIFMELLERAMLVLPLTENIDLFLLELAVTLKSFVTSTLLI